MDVLSILGLLLALVAVIGGWLVTGGSFETLINGSALMIVLGGTFGAAMVQSHISLFAYSLKMMFWVIFPPKLAAKQSIKKIIQWSNIARKEGLLGLENIAEAEQDLLARKGLQLLVDGNEPEVIKRVMEVEINSKRKHNHDAACVIEAMGRYSLMVGIVAAVIGLMQITDKISDPDMLSHGIQSALVALAYGLGLAQFVFLPSANKLKYLVSTQSQIHDMLLEGVLSIAEGENPRNIETKLQGYVL